MGLMILINYVSNNWLSNGVKNCISLIGCAIPLIISYSYTWSFALISPSIIIIMRKLALILPIRTRPSNEDLRLKSSHYDQNHEWQQVDHTYV